MKLVRGYSLIEIVAVLIIGAGLLLWVTGFTQVHGRMETAKRINHDADLLLEAMNQYYHKHCTEAVFPPVTEANLRFDGILIGAGFNNPWGGNYQLIIDRLIPRNPQLRVSVVFRNAVDAGYVAGMVEYATAAGSVVTWTKNSTLSRTKNGVRRQMDREAFGSQLC